MDRQGIAAGRLHLQQSPLTAMVEHWKVVAERKKAQQTASIPKEWIIETPAEDVLNVMNVPHDCGLLTAKELEITDLKNVDELLAKLAKGTWTAVEVTTAYYKRAIIAHQLVNCLTEIYIDKALAWAADLDKLFKETGKPVGPLHGLPISVKDQLCIEGLDTVMGYVAWIDKPAKKNAVLIDVLLQDGAVPFVRTNVPQTLMWGETFNLVYGRSVNPFNRNLTCGGSSGGEGALIALGGSPLGVGSDIGGSIRIPAGLNGLYGLRPSFHRIPYEGAMNSGLGNEGIVSVLGPLTRDVSGLRVFTKAVLGGKPWLADPYCYRKPWDEGLYKLEEHGGGGKMCFGLMWDDGIVKPLPPVRRALEITKKALEAVGHTVIDWVPPSHDNLRPISKAIFGADGGKNFDDVCKISHEPLLTTMDPSIPPKERVDEPLGTTKIFFQKEGDEAAQEPLSAYELFQVQWKKRALLKRYLDCWMATAGETGTGRPMDAIICPVAPFPAPPHGKFSYGLYTTFCNILDYTTSTFPVTTVDLAVDVPAAPRKFLSPEDQTVFSLYSSPDVFKDAPINLQLVGQRLEEEAVIGMTEIVAKALSALVQ